MSSRPSNVKHKKIKNGMTAPLSSSSSSSSSSSPSSEQPINWHDNANITDIHVPWLYEAHSVTLLFIVLSVIFYCAFTMHGSLQLGIRLNIFLFLAVGCLVFPAGPFQRPHPIFWRFLFSLSMLYCMFLLFLLSLEPDDARKTLRILFNDNTLGYPLPEKSYAMDCRLNFDVIWSVLDRFIFAHFIGWAVKAVVIRDRCLVWILSVLWEIIEIQTKYFVPNFAECWWDQLILDVLLCNGLGIEFGLFVARKWWENDRNWLGDNIYFRFKRLFFQFTPQSMTAMHWEPLSSIKRYIQMTIMVILFVFMDLNAFLLKLYLYIPTEHALNIYRLFLFVFWFMVFAKQYYLYVTDEKCKKIGSQTWVCILILILEVALSYKCAPSPFPKAPWINKMGWIGGIGIYLLFTCIMFRDLRVKK